MEISKPRNANTFSGIQAMRFIAAMMVVLAHATGMVSERILMLSGHYNYWRPGTAGVDIFFVISGFVMAISSRKLIGESDAWKTFMRLRLIRVVPMYWIATTLKIALVIAIPTMALRSEFDLQQIICSYLFIPQFTPNNYLIMPVLKVGWTLMYEMFFYLVFAFALFIKRPALSTCAMVFVVLSAANILIPKEENMFYGFGGPLLLEFVMGMLVAEIYLRGYKCNPWVGLVLVLVSFAIIFSTGYWLMTWRWVFWGIPAMVIIGVVVLCEQSIRKWLPQFFNTLGDSSYALYLFHTFTVPVLGSIFSAMHIKSTVLAVSLCMIISPLVSLIIYKVLELPLTKFFKSSVRVPSTSPLRNRI